MSELSAPLPGSRRSLLPWDRKARSSARWLLLFFPLVSLFISLSGAGSLPLMDRDEPRFAEATREMAERGEWSVPFFNGTYRLDKPPLIYWLMGISFRMFGENELGARMPSIALTALLCFLMFIMGKGFFGLRGGVASALSCATALQVLIHGRLAVADMPMVVSIVLAQWAILHLLEGGKAVWFWILWVALGLGFLAKGPIAWAVPLLGLLLWRFLLWRKPVPWRRLRPCQGILVAVGMVALWGIPALASTHGAFWTQGMGEHVLRRGMEAFDGRPHFWGYYLISAQLSLFPWSAFLGWIFVSLRDNYSSRSAFLLAWFLAPFILFTPYATQLPHYLLPGLPAFFLLFGQAAANPSRPRAGSVVLFWAVWSAGFFGGCSAIAATLVRPWEPRYQAIRATFWGLGAILLSLCFLALMTKAALFSRNATSPGTPSSRFLLALGLSLSVFGLAGGFWLLGTSLRRVEPALALRDLWKDLPPGSLFAATGYTEPSLVFYSGRRWVMEPDADRSELPPGQASPGCFVRLNREATLQDGLRWLFFRAAVHREASLPSPPPFGNRDRSTRTFRVEGFDSARFSWVELDVHLRPDGGVAPAPSQ